MSWVVGEQCLGLVEEVIIIGYELLSPFEHFSGGAMAFSTLRINVGTWLKELWWYHGVKIPFDARTWVFESLRSVW